MHIAMRYSRVGAMTSEKKMLSDDLVPVLRGIDRKELVKELVLEGRKLKNHGDCFTKTYKTLQTRAELRLYYVETCNDDRQYYILVFDGRASVEFSRRSCSILQTKYGPVSSVEVVIGLEDGDSLDVTALLEILGRYIKISEFAYPERVMSYLGNPLYNAALMTDPEDELSVYIQISPFPGWDMAIVGTRISASVKHTHLQSPSLGVNMSKQPVDVMEIVVSFRLKNGLPFLGKETTIIHDYAGPIASGLKVRRCH